MRKKRGVRPRATSQAATRNEKYTGGKKIKKPRR